MNTPSLLYFGVGGSCYERVSPRRHEGHKEARRDLCLRNARSAYKTILIFLRLRRGNCEASLCFFVSFVSSWWEGVGRVSGGLCFLNAKSAKVAKFFSFLAFLAA